MLLVAVLTNPLDVHFDKESFLKLAFGNCALNVFIIDIFTRHDRAQSTTQQYFNAELIGVVLKSPVTTL